MPSSEKKEKVKQIEKWFDASGSVLVLRYKGLKVFEANELRAMVGKSDAELRVLKNTLTRIALDDTPHQELIKYIDGPIAVVFAGREPAAVARVIKDYSRGREDFGLLGGWFQDTLITGKQAELLATLPPREALLARMLGQAAAPLYGLVGVCAGPLRKMLGLFQALKEKAEADAPAPDVADGPEGTPPVPAPETAAVGEAEAAEAVAEKPSEDAAPDGAEQEPPAVGETDAGDAAPGPEGAPAADEGKQEEAE